MRTTFLMANGVICPLFLLRRNGRVNGVECVRLRSMAFDADGKLSLDVLEGSEHVMAADTVIYAVGIICLSPFLSFFVDFLMQSTTSGY